MAFKFIYHNFFFASSCLLLLFRSRVSFYLWFVVLSSPLSILVLSLSSLALPPVSSNAALSQWNKGILSGFVFRPPPPFPPNLTSLALLGATNVLVRLFPFRLVSVCSLYSSYKFHVYTQFIWNYLNIWNIHGTWACNEWLRFSASFSLLFWANTITIDT